VVEALDRRNEAFGYRELAEVQRVPHPDDPSLVGRNAGKGSGRDRNGIVLGGQGYRNPTAAEGACCERVGPGNLPVDSIEHSLRDDVGQSDAVGVSFRFRREVQDDDPGNLRSIEVGKGAAGLTAAGVFFLGVGIGPTTDRTDTVAAIIVFGVVYVPATVGARRLFGP